MVQEKIIRTEIVQNPASFAVSYISVYVSNPLEYETNLLYSWTHLLRPLIVMSI